MGELNDDSMRLAASELTLPETLLQSLSSQGDNGTPFARRRQFAVPSQSRWAQKWRQIKTRVKHILGKINQFMTVPMYSALLSIFIALIPPLQAKLVEAKPLTQAIKSAGSCSSEFRPKLLV